jgi:hypothetical protein
VGASGVPGFHFRITHRLIANSYETGIAVRQRKHDVVEVKDIDTEAKKN